MTILGIEPIVAMIYKVEIYESRRFPNSWSVGAYLGMTPRQYSSGEICKQDRISKYGLKDMRSLLTEAGLVLLTKVKKMEQTQSLGIQVY